LAIPAPPSALAAALRVFRPQTASAVASNRDSSSRRRRLSSRVLTSTATSPAHRQGRRTDRSTSPGLLRPFNTCQRRGSTVGRRCHAPATFRLQGLATLVTVCSPRRLAGLVSSRQRSWDFPLRSILLPGGGLGFPPTPNPHAGFTATCSGAPKHAGRTSRPPTPGLWPSPGVPWRPAGV
jgi:hypothetical protein